MSQVSPSIPTQAEAALPLLPEGVGTVKVPVTVVKVPYWQKMRPWIVASQGDDTNVTLSPDSTSPVFAVLYIGDTASRRLDAVDRL